MLDHTPKKNQSSSHYQSIKAKEGPKLSFSLLSPLVFCVLSLFRFLSYISVL